MARIRTVKPELFRHEDLHKAEKESGLPLRLAFIGLFTVADREGRFRWKPRPLQLDVMPYDKDVDFVGVLETLADYGFVEKYEHEGELIGVIPSFRRHQVINAREKASELPDPKNCTKLPTRGRVRTEETVHAHGEGKGREEEKEGKGREVHDEPRVTTREPSKAQAVIAIYCETYKTRFGKNPEVRRQDANQLKNATAHMGLERAKELVETYVHWDDPWFVQRGHDLTTFAGSLNKVAQRADGISRSRITAQKSEQDDFYRDQLAAVRRGEI